MGFCGEEVLAMNGWARGLSLNYPESKRGKIVVWSLLAAMPVPGMTWHRLQYLAGLRRLGFDVWYVEDSDRTVKDPTTLDTSSDYRPNLDYLDRHMRLIGLEDRWVFRPPGQFE